jgi:hypothetical protein
VTLSGPCSCGPSGKGSEYHSRDDDRSVGPGDDCIRDADEEADQSARNGRMHRERNIGSEKANGEAVKKALVGSRLSGRFMGSIRSTSMTPAAPEQSKCRAIHGRIVLTSLTSARLSLSET